LQFYINDILIRPFDKFHFSSDRKVFSCRAMLSVYRPKS
jgi:hypothetical protein